MTHATETLFGGASEGGKSTGVRFCLISWHTFIASLQSFIYRKYYNDVISNHMDGPTSFPELLRPWVKEKLVRLRENEIEFVWNNSLISLAQLRTEEDVEKARGREKHVLVLDESTQIVRRHIEGVRGWVRMPIEMKQKLSSQIGHMYPHLTAAEHYELFPRIIYTANPEGVSVNYFRKQFVKARDAFQIERTIDKEGGFLRQYVPSRIDDNPSADKEAQRRRLSAFGEAKAKALIHGSWDEPTGDFFTEFDEDLHVVEDFLPKKEWTKFRVFDWGTSDPAVCLWFCVADGSDVKSKEGNTLWFPSGSLICYREWYICDPENPDKGLHMRNHDMAQGIINRTPESTSNITLSDGWPFSDRGASNSSAPSKKYTIADVFADNGVPLMKANLARVQGWSQMRDRLIGVQGVPLIYFTRSCSYCRDYIPALPYSDTNPEDAADSGEATHVCDCIRYACAARPVTIRAPTESKVLVQGKNHSTVTPTKILKRLNPPKRKLR